MTQNQLKAQIEKAEQYEKAARRLGIDNDNETNRDFEDRDSQIVQDIKDQQNQIYKLSEENKSLRQRLFEAEQKMSDSEKIQNSGKSANNNDLKKLQEQRDLLIDLRQKVQMYERELKLITEQSSSEIDALTK